MRRFIQLILAFGLASFTLQPPANASVKVEDSVTIDAPPEAVWSALKQYQKEEKQFDKKRSSVEDNKVVLKEKFMSIPVVGSTSFSYVEESHPQTKTVDFKLTDSKVLTKFEGAWRIIEKPDGKGVTLKLVTDIDTWMIAPFKNKILGCVTRKGMEKRLAYVKNCAEEIGAQKVSSSSNKHTN